MKRLSLVSAVCLILAGASSASGAEPRVIILGFDGVEPTIVEEMMAAGELPNLSAVRESGSYAHLGSSNPPQSPTAWSSFATSTFPGNHGIYDFLRRTPKNYRPGVGFGSVVKPKLAPDGSLAEPPSFKSIRQGQTFWKVANEQGARCKILSVPFAFPADDLDESCMLSGLGVPDIRGTTSTFFLMSEDATQAKNLSGGKLLPLRFTGDRATVALEALRHPQTRKFLKVSVGVVVDRTEKRVTLELPNKTIPHGQGEWSEGTEGESAVRPECADAAVSRVSL